MKKIYAVLITLLLVISFSSTAFAFEFTIYEASDLLEISEERKEEILKEAGSAPNATQSAPQTPAMQTPAPAAPQPLKAERAVPTASAVLVNGKTVNFDAYNINGYNYFKLRDIAMAVNNTEKNFHVGFNSTYNTISLSAGNAYIPVGGELAAGDGKEKTATPTSSKIEVDMEYITPTAYNIGGYNYFKLRDICKEFNIGVGFDGATNTIMIDTASGYSE